MIEDNPGDARLIRELLAEASNPQFKVYLADRLSVGLQRLVEGGIDAVLLDLALPDSTGLDTFAQANAQAPSVPIVVLTGLDDDELASKAMHEGAQDFLPKGMVDANLLVRSLRYAIERKRAEAVAQRQAAEMRGIVQNMVESVFVSDAEGSITLVNEAAVRLMGLDGQGELKRALPELPTLLRMRHPDGTAMAVDEMPFVRAIKGETVAQEDMVLYNARLERDIHVRASASPICSEMGKIIGAVTVVMDVTDLVELDRIKDGFIAVVAHELKTPVAIMKGYAQMLLRANGEPAVQSHKMLEAVNRGCDRIDGIVQDMLDISRLVSGHLILESDRFDLSELVTEVIDRTALTAPKHHIQLLSAQPAVVQGDRSRLEQVVVNLMDNAIKYSPKGGDIDVAVAVRNTEAEVSVRDHGVGIAKEKQANIFQRFYSAHTGTPNDYGGIGVGLHISNEIVILHGGRMWFESAEGKGSTFHFSLPLV